jgi:Leucine-rich repeat (LRR) protein
MSIKVTYADGKIQNYSKFEDIENDIDVIIVDCSSCGFTKLSNNIGSTWNNLQTFNCSFNQIKSFPKNFGSTWSNLQIFFCDVNDIESFPENFGSTWVNLRFFNCSNNILTSLPENLGSTWVNLQTFNCGWNKIESFPEKFGFTWNNLQKFYCYENQIESFPENFGSTWINLQEFYCFENQIELFPENFGSTWVNLQTFDCGHNKLTSLPLSILNWRRLTKIYYYDNEIDLPPQLLRFIDRIQNKAIEMKIYNDGQNVHSSSIQSSVKESIERLTIRKDLPKYNLEELNNIILENDNINCKELLFEYIANNEIHTTMLLTFSEVLWFVLNTIEKDFSKEQQIEIYNVLNIEMKDSECKCFTGRLSRLVNCLNGFSSLVTININSSEQIANIIQLTKNNMIEYNVEEHKKIVRKELQERDYPEETIEEWLGYIE